MRKYEEHLRTKGYSSKTVHSYLADVQRFITWMKQQNLQIEEVGYADILYYMQSKRGHVKQASISKAINSLRHYFDHLIATSEDPAQWGGENPTRQVTIKGIRRRQLYDILDRKELDALYHKCQWEPDQKNSEQNWYKASELVAVRNKVIIGLLVYQGLSACDIAQLKQSDLKLREGTVFIERARRSNERELSLGSVQILDLMEYSMKTRPALLELSAKQSEKLILSTGSGHKIHNAMHRVKQHVQQLDQRVTSIKQIRASVITHWLKLYDLRQVQYMAGHRYVSSTEAYNVNDLDDLMEDIGRFHPIG